MNQIQGERFHSIQGTTRRGARRPFTLRAPLSFITILVFIPLLLSGCFANNRKALSTKLDRSYLNLANQTLVQVVRSSSNTDQVRLIGDGSGALTKDCAKSANNFGQTVADDGTGPSTCRCVFRYAMSVSNNGELLSEETDTISREANMITCPLTAALRAGSVPFAQISVRYGASAIALEKAASDSFSNEVTLNLGSGSGTALDPTLASSFAKVLRYQCTDLLTITTNYWSDVYDRNMSEDPRMTTAMNFYTTNLGQSMAIIASGYRTGNSSGRKPQTGWDCPANPMDERIQYSEDFTKNATLLRATYRSGPSEIALGADFQNPGQPLWTKYDMRLHSLASIGSISVANTTSPQPGSTGDWSAAIYPRTSATQENKTDFFVAKQPTGVFQIPVNAIVAPGINTDPAGQKGPLPIGYAALTTNIATNGIQGESCPGPEIPIPNGYKWAKLWLFRSSLYKRSILTFPRGTAANLHFDNKALACGHAINEPAQGDPAFMSASASVRYELSPTATNIPSLNVSGSQIVNSNGAPWAMVEDQENTGTVTNSTQRFDYVYVVSPTNIHFPQVQFATDEAKPYIPARYISSLDCRTNGGTNEPCLAGRTLPTYELATDFGAAFSTIDLSLSSDARAAGRYTKFPLCVLQQVN